MRVLENIEPRKVMAFFEDLSGKHRCSQHEKAATDYIAAFAEARGLTYHRDALDNIIVKKPGTKGYETAPTVILLGHIDMVCKLDEGVTHDFAKDGVKLRVDGDRIRATGTTLSLTPSFAKSCVTPSSNLQTMSIWPCRITVGAVS